MDIKETSMEWHSAIVSRCECRFVETVGSVSEDAIRTYIENQTNAR